jgi:hypothetical protein
MKSIANSGVTRRAALRGLGALAFITTTAPCVRAVAQPAGAEVVPEWFRTDFARKAQWLPDHVRHSYTIQDAYEKRMDMFEQDLNDPTVQAQLEKLGLKNITIGQIKHDLEGIPQWMVALSSTVPSLRAEIIKQIHFAYYLAGPAPQNPLAIRCEQLLVFAGAAKLPTPGDGQTGHGLANEGCAAAITRYPLAQVLAEYPEKLPGIEPRIGITQSSKELTGLFAEAAKRNLMTVQTVPFMELQAEQMANGTAPMPASCVVIANKMDGTHVFGMTRVPVGWGWSNPLNRIAVGNTGLRMFAPDTDNMRLAQEYVSPDWADQDHNKHGQFLSQNLVRKDGKIDMKADGTNVYFANALLATRMGKPERSNVHIINFNAG